MQFCPQLDDEILQLVALQSEHHDQLAKIAFDADIWRYSPTPINTADDLQRYMQKALTKRELGEHYPYVVILKSENKVIGATRYYDIADEHLTTSIGYSWLDKAYRGKDYNLRMKRLLLKQAFELGVRRVAMIIDTQNIRSRKAAEKCGFQFEGIMKKHMILHGNRRRDTAIYALLDEEWPAVFAGMNAKLGLHE